MPDSKRTFTDLVFDVREAAGKQGMDVSAQDVGFIISLFLEGVLQPPGSVVAPVAAFLQKIADECSDVRDEV
jgi:hypothetical protein